MKDGAPQGATRAVNGETILSDPQGATRAVNGETILPIVLSDEESVQVARLRYISEHGVKENLVASPRLWPGFHCANELIDGKPLNGIWYGRAWHL